MKSLNNIFKVILTIVLNLITMESFSSFSIFNSKIINRNIFKILDSTNDENNNILLNNEIKKIDLLYDSECPICAMEVDFLKKRDFENRIKFTDLSSPSYNPADHGNVKFEEGMRKIRAILPDNTVVTGVEVFRQTYNAIGLGWIFDITNIPIIGKAADALYDIWAENRLRLTGRGDLADVLKARSEALKDADPAECNTDACDLNWDD